MEDSIFSSSNTVESSRILYTPSSFSRSALFHVQETGTLQAIAPHTSERNNLNSYLFFIVSSGSGSLTYEGKTYPLSPNDCVFIDCRGSYSHSTSDDLWSLQWVHFYGSNMAEIMEKYRERGGSPVFHPRTPNIYHQLLDELYAIASSDSYVRDMELHTQLSSLLIHLMKDAWSDKETTKFGMSVIDVQNIKDYLDEHFTEKMSLDDLAKRFYITKFYLTRLFKDRYGTTITDYVIHRKITLAKQLLRFTDKTVEEIAFECGFNGLPYFSRTFKQIEGVSPTEYRMKW